MCGGVGVGGGVGGVFFQAEDGIRDLVRSRGLGDVYKRQVYVLEWNYHSNYGRDKDLEKWGIARILYDRCGAKRACDIWRNTRAWSCLLYTSDAADERSSVDLGGRRIIKNKTQKKKQKQTKKQKKQNNE